MRFTASAFVFSAALCRGLIEAGETLRFLGYGNEFSAALCRGLIEAPVSL